MLRYDACQFFLSPRTENHHIYNQMDNYLDDATDSKYLSFSLVLCMWGTGQVVGWSSVALLFFYTVFSYMQIHLFQNFQYTLRCLKLWAKRRGVYGTVSAFVLLSNVYFHNLFHMHEAMNSSSSCEA